MGVEYNYCENCKECLNENYFHQCKVCDNGSDLCNWCVKQSNLLRNNENEIVAFICNDCIEDNDYDELLSKLNKNNIDTSRLKELIPNEKDFFIFENRLIVIEKEIKKLTNEKRSLKYRLKKLSK